MTPPGGGRRDSASVVDRQPGESHPPQQLRVSSRPAAGAIRVRRASRAAISGSTGAGRSASTYRAVSLALDRAHAAGGRRSNSSHDRASRRRASRARSRSRSGSRLRVVAAAPGLHVHRDDELGVADAAFAPEHGAVAGREQEARRPRRPPPRHAIRIAGEDRPPKPRRSPQAPSCPCRRRVLRLLRDLRRRGHVAHVRRQRPLVVYRRQQIARRRRRMRRQRRGAPRAARRRARPVARRRPRRACAPGAGAAAAASSARRARVTPLVANRAERLQQRERRVRAARPTGARTTRTSAGRRPTRGSSSTASREIRRDGSRARRAAAADRASSHSRSTRPGPSAAGAARALRRRIGRHALELERVDAAILVVARDLVQAGVDDRGDARHGQRRLRDVGGENHAARPAPAIARSCSSAGSDPCSGETSTSAPTAARASPARDRSRRRRAGNTARCPRVAPSAPRPAAATRCAAGSRSRSDAGVPARRRAGSRRETRASGPTSSVADMTTSRRSSRAPTPASRARARGRRGRCARGTRRARSCGSR